jgi:hypothetical protein
LGILACFLVAAKKIIIFEFAGSSANAEQAEVGWGSAVET